MPMNGLPANGAAIRAIRRAYGLTLEDVASHAKITVSSLGNIERNRRGASATVLRAIAERLHVPLDAVVRCQLPADLAS